MPAALLALTLLARQAPGEADRIEAILQERAQLPGAVGLSVAVARGDEVVYSRAFGLANLEFPVPADGETLFRIASVTKQFTAAAILKLDERGKLALDDPLASFLPDFPTHGQDITLRHLLTHTSGIPNVTDLGRKWSDLAARELTHEEMLALWKDLPLDFAPGERWKYSNSGYYLLGMVIETVSGKPYAEFLRAEFFEPLGMKRTRLDSNAELIPDRAQGYAFASGVFQNDRLIGMSQPFSSGALLSTAGDLVRWQTALAGGRALKPESYEEMKLSFVLADGKETNYGMGLFLSPVAGHPCVWHSGDIFGFNSALAYFPETKLSIAALSNSEGLSTEKLVEALAVTLLAGSIQAGKARICLPSGWRLEKEKPEVKVLRSEDGRQQCTFSVIPVSPSASLEDFESICRLRIEGEKRELSDGFVESDSPFQHEGRFGMFFSGGDRKDQRVFSGYLVLEAAELITIYVEGVGVDPKEHLECFRSFVSGLQM